jgi:hypothetical protein
LLSLASPSRRSDALTFPAVNPVRSERCFRVFVRLRQSDAGG